MLVYPLNSGFLLNILLVIIIITIIIFIIIIIILLPFQASYPTGPRSVLT